MRTTGQERTVRPINKAVQSSFDADVDIGKLLELFPVHAVLTYPVSEQAMQAGLQGCQKPPIT